MFIINYETKGCMPRLSIILIMNGSLLKSLLLLIHCNSFLHISSTDCFIFSNTRGLWSFMDNLYNALCDCMYRSSIPKT